MEEYDVTLNGTLTCSGEYEIFQTQRRARCAVWFSMTDTVVYWSQSFIQDSRRQDESCRKKILDLTELSPLAHIPAWQLWKTLTQVYTACLFGSHSGRSTGHSLSFAICSDSLTPFGALSPLWSYNTEHNEMMQGRNTRRFKYTRTSAGKMEPHREMHIGSEQSVAGCKKACVWIRAECKAVFYARSGIKQVTESPPAGKSWAETLAAKTEAPLRGRIVFFSWIQKKIKYLH